MSENNVNGEEKKWYQLSGNTKLRLRLIKITILSVIIYAVYSSAQLLGEIIYTSTLDPKYKVYLASMMPIILISITAIAMGLLGNIEDVKAKVDSTPSPGANVQTMPSTQPVSAPVAPSPTTPAS